MRWWWCWGYFMTLNGWYGHYIDDILLMWGHNVMPVQEFDVYVNSNQLSSWFTINTDSKEIYFLNIILKDKGVKKYIYDNVSLKKPVADNTILGAKNCHPKHTILTIPVGEMTCAKKACTEEKDYRIRRWRYQMETTVEALQGFDVWKSVLSSK